MLLCPTLVLYVIVLGHVHGLFLLSLSLFASSCCFVVDYCRPRHSVALQSVDMLGVLIDPLTPEALAQLQKANISPAKPKDLSAVCADISARKLQTTALCLSVHVEMQVIHICTIVQKKLQERKKNARKLMDAHRRRINTHFTQELVARVYRAAGTGASRASPEKVSQDLLFLPTPNSQ